MESKELAEQLVGATGGLHWLSSVKAAAAGTSASVWIPVVAAVIAATAAGWSALLQRRTGKEATATARKSAEAAQASADASHRSATAAEEMGSRTDAAALAERYQDAASQLGHDKAAVRLAGVYAMSRLADDWREERQTCIDVLCAYLRLPWQDTADSPVGRDELQVRRTIVSVINHHVAEDSKVSWVENDFDFTRAQLREFILEGCVFAGHVSFSGAEFTGECRLIDIAFRGRAVFDSCTVVDRMQLAKVGAESDGRLTFVAARIPSGAELKIEPNTKDPQGSMSPNSFREMKVQGKLTVARTHSFYQKQLPLDLDRMELDGGCVQVICPVDLTKDRRPRYPCTIWAREWKIAPGSEIDIPQDLIDNGTVRWGGYFYKQSDIPADAKISFRIPTADL